MTDRYRPPAKGGEIWKMTQAKSAILRTTKDMQIFPMYHTCPVLWG